MFYQVKGPNLKIRTVSKSASGPVVGLWAGLGLWYNSRPWARPAGEGSPIASWHVRRFASWRIFVGSRAQRDGAVTATSAERRVPASMPRRTLNKCLSVEGSNPGVFIGAVTCSERLAEEGHHAWTP